MQQRLGGGQLLAAISKAIVALLREHHGRGPTRTKTYALDDVVVVVMRGSGLTPLEQTLMDHAGAERVVALRREFQEIMAPRYRAMIERLTGRVVVATLAQAHLEPEITIETFFLDAPLDGLGPRGGTL